MWLKTGDLWDINFQRMLGRCIRCFDNKADEGKWLGGSRCGVILEIRDSGAAGGVFPNTRS